MRAAALVGAICVAAFALAAAARYGLVEPAEMRATCDGGAQSSVCLLRAWIIQAFVHQRIGWFALTAAGFAFVSGWRSVAALALFAACAGLVLYTTELSAPAALLAVLVFARPANASGQPSAAASSSSTAL